MYIAPLGKDTKTGYSIFNNIFKLHVNMPESYLVFPDEYKFNSEVIRFGEVCFQSYFNRNNVFLESVEAMDISEEYIQQESKTFKEADWDERNQFSFEEYNGLSLNEKIQMHRLHSIKDGLKYIANDVAINEEGMIVDEVSDKHKKILLLSNNDNKNQFSLIVEKFEKKFDENISNSVFDLFKKECGIDSNYSISKTRENSKSIKEIESIKTDIENKAKEGFQFGIGGSRYRINIDGAEYRVPRRVQQIYNLIQNSDGKNNKAILNEIRDISRNANEHQAGLIFGRTQRSTNNFIEGLFHKASMDFDVKKANEKNLES